MANQHASKTNDNPVVQHEVERLLNETPAYRQLDNATQKALKASMVKIGEYLSGTSGIFSHDPLASQLAPPDLRQRLTPQNRRQSSATQTPGQTKPGQETPARRGAGQGTTGRVGEVARATLNAIDFPGFVASLIQGTFQAIVDASIQQMEAYAVLLNNVAGTVDQFMADNISDGTARDYLTDKYEGFIARDTSAGQPRLSVNREAMPEGEMPSFFRELGFESPDDIDEQAIEEVIVPATRNNLAQLRQQTLATMVLMGINRVVVDDGEITAKLQFHIDASEMTDIRFDQTKTTVGNISGRAGRSPFSANAVLVNTTSLNAQSDINIRTDLTGQVKVRFRSETFPLERFADSAAIQLINQNARVPQAQTPETPEPGEIPVPQPAASPPAPPPVSAPAPATQSLGDRDDPWAPKEEK